MIFSSTIFILGFLPGVFLIHVVLQRARLPAAAKLWLIAASLFFYGYWNPVHLPLLAASIWFNHRVGLRLLARGPAWTHRAVVLGLAVAADLALLGLFKYADFAVANFDAFTGAAWPLPGLVLPLGISFFTFTQIAWLVDGSRGDVAGAGAADYVLFVTYFPHLIAGPILHHREMMSQFASRWNRLPRWRNVERALFLFSIGLAKKVLLADTFAIWADDGFDGAQPLDFYVAWACSLAYAFQLYFDFSGYCDMAMGASLLFNVRLPLNFDSPYQALDIRDFWRRWHITLGRFLRDYVYIPLGGNRGGSLRVQANLLMTFVLGGLWHGASWMFVTWGALHGAALAIHHAWRRTGVRLPPAAAWLLTFVFVDVAWVFFRAHDWGAARRVLVGMVDWRSALGGGDVRPSTAALGWAGPLLDASWNALPRGLAATLPALAAIAVGFVLVARTNAVRALGENVPGARRTALSLLAFAVAFLVLSATRESAFLYFNF